MHTRFNHCHIMGMTKSRLMSVVFAAVAADSHSGDAFKLSAETTALPDLPLSTGRGKVPGTAAADSNQRALTV